MKYLIFTVIGVYLFNSMTLTWPITKKINEDKRNEGISVKVRYKHYIFLNTLEFNLKNVSTEKASVDVFRVLLQTASHLKDKKFKKVELSYRGTTKFILTGDYFRQLGIELDKQNPMYTVRTFPENLYNKNGEASYGRWEGGMFRVFEKQMEDFNDFNKKWYIDELMSK